MRLLLVRHAIAVPRGTPGIPDNDRPLTPMGVKKFRIAARGIVCVVRRPDGLLSSPLPRALDTARILGAAWERIEPRIERSLAGGSFEDLRASLARFPTDATVALVGHEPHLSGFLASLLDTRDGGRMTFRKGGAALVEVEHPRLHKGSLIWFMPPRILRRLGTGRRSAARA